MDIATIVGLVMGIGLVIGSILIGGSLVPFINVPSLMITVGGSIAALLINFSLETLKGAVNVMKKCFLVKLPSTTDTIEKFTELAGIARRDGLIALEPEVEKLTDQFMIRGLELVMGGVAKEEIISVLEIEIAYIEQRHEQGKKIVDATAAAAPAFGMIGTLIGLVQMLRNLDDPSQIGVGMATALLTTLYGALIANLFCLPLSGKLEARSKEEVMLRELMMSGLVSLIDGQPPRSVRERLLAYMSASERPNMSQAA
jgi:chemotaxis protein MotA